MYVTTDDEKAWGATVFPTWKEFEHFAVNKSLIPPSKKAKQVPSMPTFTPWLQTKELTSVSSPQPTPEPPPKIFPSASDSVTYSGFDYVDWGKDSGFQPQTTIQLVPKDHKVMERMGYKLTLTPTDNAYSYENDAKDTIQFFVDGIAKYHNHKWKPDQPQVFDSIKLAMQYLWQEYNKQNPVKKNLYKEIMDALCQ